MIYCSSWEYLLVKLSKNISRWTFRPLNLSNKLILFKVILQIMPLYIFSTLVAPKLVIKVIHNLQITFLQWGSNTQHKWAVVKYDTLYMPKLAGALVLRDLEVMRNVLGAKIWWRWMTYSFEPWEILWHNKYVPILKKIWPHKILRGSRRISNMEDGIIE